jgi:hypothetical protein
MVQHAAISTMAVEAAEVLEDEFRACAADGVICAAEIAYLLPKVRTVLVKTQKVDLVQAAAIALIRGGQQSPRATRLLREVETFMPADAA